MEKKQWYKDKVARMSGVLSDEQLLALIDMINRRKGGFRSLLKHTFHK